MKIALKFICWVTFIIITIFVTHFAAGLVSSASTVLFFLGLGIFILLTAAWIVIIIMVTDQIKKKGEK